MTNSLERRGFREFLSDCSEDAIAFGGMAAIVGGFTVAIALTYEDNPGDKRSKACQETDYRDVSVDLPDKLIVNRDGTITDRNGELFLETKALHFSGLESLEKNREDIANAMTLAELQSETDEAFSPLQLDVFFTADSDFPDPVVESHPDTSIEKLLPKQRNLPQIKREIDELLIGETFRPDEFREVGNRSSVTLVKKWGYDGQAFTDLSDDTAHFVRRVGYSRRVASTVNAHEAGHNFEERVCQENYGNDAVTAIRNKDDQYSPDEPPYKERKNGSISYDKERFISAYSATDGYNEEWAEAAMILYADGYPEPQSQSEPTVVDKKFATVAQIHDLYAPGSLEYFLALGTRKLCFDVVLDKELYKNDKIPEQRYTCDNDSE